MKRNTLLWICFGALALAASACKQAAIEPVAELPVDDIGNYFWPASTLQALFNDSTGALTNSLRLSPAPNGLNVTDRSIGSTTGVPLTFNISRNEINGLGFTAGTVLDLDPYSFFAADTQVSIQPALHTAIIASSVGYLVATDQGVYILGKINSTTYGWFKDSDILFDFLVTDQSTVYGVTRGGEIWQRPNQASATWSRMTSLGALGRLNAIVLVNNILYAAPVTGGVKQSSSSGWLPFVPSITNEVSALYMYNDRKLLIGSADGESHSFDFSKKTLTGLHRAIQERITCYLSFPAGLAVGTDSGIWWCLNDTDSWHKKVDKVSVAALAQRKDKNGTLAHIAYISGGKVGVVDTNGVNQSIPPVTETVVTFIPGNSSVVANHALYSLPDGAAQWEIAIGPIPIERNDLRGPLSLLRNNKTSSGSAWRAGTLVYPTSNWQWYPITARVVEHLDKLTLATKDYNDVLHLRYAHEENGTTVRDTIPTWDIYYQRGQGPILFEKRKNGRLMRKQIAK